MHANLEIIDHCAEIAEHMEQAINKTKIAIYLIEKKLNYFIIER